jgi:hypothetical protein
MPIIFSLILKYAPLPKVIQKINKILKDHIMSVSFLRTQPQAAPAYAQQEAPFSIADNTMPSGGGGNCDEIRDPLFNLILTAIQININEEFGRSIDQKYKQDVSQRISNYSGQYRDCDPPDGGTPDDVARHEVIKEYQNFTGGFWGNTPEQAIGRLAGDVQDATEGQSLENPFSLGAIGTVLLWLYNGGNSQPGFSH